MFDRRRKNGWTWKRAAMGEPWSRLSRAKRGADLLIYEAWHNSMEFRNIHHRSLNPKMLFLNKINKAWLSQDSHPYHHLECMSTRPGQCKGKSGIWHLHLVLIHASTQCTLAGPQVDFSLFWTVLALFLEREKKGRFRFPLRRCLPSEWGFKFPPISFPKLFFFFSIVFFTFFDSFFSLIYNFLSPFTCYFMRYWYLKL